MARRYTIKVYAKRGDQPAYTYIQEPRVKASKADRILADAAWGILDHETRGKGTGSVVEAPRGGYIIRVGICKFIIRKVAI